MRIRHPAGESLLAGLAAAFAIFGAATAALVLIVGVSSQPFPNPSVEGYAPFYGGGGLCMLLGALVLIRVVPAVRRHELGTPTVVANLVIQAFLWLACVAGLLGLGAS